MLKRMLSVLYVLLLAGVAVAQAQQREIRGRVVDAGSGAPLAGASVVVVGSSTGTQSGADGTFVLRAPAGPVRVRASMLGYRTATAAVSGEQSSVTLQLETDVLNLEGVVVTGQVTSVARRNLANAVATVTAQELNQAPAQSVDKALQGKIAGANIATNSGAPGGGVQVNLRGVASINGASEPLWVVDGVVVSNVAIPSNQNAVTSAAGGSNPSLTQDAQVNRIADLNPLDIESIEVLKGASASAIYGSQASNGVIIVTTKRGRAGTPQVNVTQRFGTYQLANKLGMRSWTRDEAVGAFGNDAAAYFNADGTPKQAFDLEELLAGRRDLSTETSVSVQGGSDSGTRYYISGLVQEDAGIINNTGFERQSVRANLSQTLGPRVTANVNLNILHTLAQRGLTNNDNTGTSFYMVFPFTPNFVDLRETGVGTFPANPFERSNPLETASRMNNDEDVWRLISSGDVRVDLLSREDQALNLRFNGGSDFFRQRNSLFFPPELQFEPNDQLPGTSLLTNADNLNLTGNAALVHTWTPGGSWTATTSGGLQYSDADLGIVRNVGRNLIAGQRNVDAATSINTIQTRQRVRTLGLYVQEELLLLEDRLLLTGSVRADRSSANGDTERYFYYPKASASYRLLEPLPATDELKLRLAYGESGNQPLFGQKFTPLNATTKVQGLAGLIIPLENTRAVAGDPDIRPERTREIEGGFDAALLGGNASLEFTVYQRSITDLLLQRTVAPSTGFASQFFNGGELRTRGVEAAVGATPLRSGDRSWTTRVTFSTNQSRIMDLPVPKFRTGGFGTALGSFEIEEGQSATRIVGYNGKDANGNLIVANMGDANPDFRMGFSNDVSMGRFNLYGLLDWQQGGDVINLTRLLFDAGQNSVDFELPEGITKPRPIPECNPNCSGLERISGFGTYTQQYVEDGSYLKLRELSLTYNLSPQLLSRVGFGARSAQIVLSGRNLVTWTKYSGLDPEVSNFGNQPVARSIDVAPFPPSRSFWLAFNLGL